MSLDTPLRPIIKKINDVDVSNSQSNPQVISNFNPSISWTYVDPQSILQKSVIISLYNITDSVIVQDEFIKDTSVQNYTFESDLKLDDGKLYKLSIKVKNNNDEISPSSLECFISTIIHQTFPIKWDMIDTQRISNRPIITMTIGVDTYDFKQDFKLSYTQYLWNPTTNSFSIKSSDEVIIESRNNIKNWEVWNGSEWIDMPLNGIKQSEYSKVRYKFIETKLEENSLYIFTAQSYNYNSLTYGAKNNPLQLRCGNKIDFKTKILSSYNKPHSIIGAYSGSKHTSLDCIRKVLVTNNAFDDSPIWEDATDSIIANDIYTFQNTVKTAKFWGVQVRLQLEINENILDPVFISAMGFSIKTD